MTNLYTVKLKLKEKREREKKKMLEILQFEIRFATFSSPCLFKANNLQLKEKKLFSFEVGFFFTFSSSIFLHNNVMN